MTSPLKDSPDSDFMRQTRARWKQMQEADEKQKRRELDDLAFYAGEQWPEEILQLRQGQQAMGGMPAVPARPSLVINKVREPVRQVLNQERQADMGIELVPADDFESVQGPIDHTEIELREGLIRRIQRQSHASDARTWAFQRAVIAGRGFYAVSTKYVGGKTMDQEIVLHRFYNQSSVGLDPTHEQPDGSDAQWGFAGATNYTADAYEREFGESEDYDPWVCACSDDEWRLLGDDAPGWFTTDGEGDKAVRLIRVADFYYFDYETITLVQGIDGRVYDKTELPAGVAIAKDSYDKDITRKDTKKSLKWCKLNGYRVLERTDCPGQFIPIVKVLGDEMQPYNNQERRSEGMVRSSRDSQVGFNAMVSKLVELVGLTPLAPLAVEEGTIEGYESWYAAANTRTLPYLPYKRTNLDGQPANKPEAIQRQAQIGDVSQSIGMFDQAIKSTTGVPDPTLGNVDPALKSGRAIKALLEQSQRGTSNYLDNLKRSMNYEAQIINDKLYDIYGRRPGRLLRTMNGTGESEAVLYDQPFQHVDAGPNGQKMPQPVQVPDGQPMPKDAKHYKLTPGANFNVAIKISKNYDTRREQEAAMLGDLIAASPEAMAVVGDLFFKNQDGPGHDEMAERYRLMLAPPIQAKLSEQTPLPPQVQMMMQQAQQQIAQLSELADKNKTDLIKTKMQQDSDTARVQMELASKEKIALIQASTTLTATQAKIDAEDARTFVDAMENRLSAQLDLHMRRLDHMHEAQQSQHQAAHSAGMAERGHQQSLEQGEQGAQIASAQMAQQAALQPAEGTEA